MKRVTIIVAVALFGAVMSGHFSPLQAQAPQAPLTDEYIKELKSAVDVHERYLGQLYELLSDLQYAADDSRNADRRAAINGIHELMGQVILQMEGEISKNRVIQTHGEIQYTHERQEKKAGITTPGSRKEFQQNFDTGGSTSDKYWIYRLAQMQSVYRVCSTAREPAISKHHNGLPFFMDKSEEFARLMERNISDVYGVLPDVAEPERPSKDKYQARKSKFE